MGEVQKRLREILKVKSLPVRAVASAEKQKKKLPFYLFVSLILKIREFLFCKFSLIALLLCELNWLLLAGLGAQVPDITWFLWENVPRYLIYKASLET